MTINGELTTAGTTCGGGCDYVFDRGYQLASIEEHAAQMWKDKHLPAVGSTKENAPFNITEKTTGMLNELEKAHIYIEQLNKVAMQRNKEITQMRNNIVNNNQMWLKESVQLKQQFVIELADRGALINKLLARMDALEAK